jgi:hypothetical protein
MPLFFVFGCRASFEVHGFFVLYLIFAIVCGILQLGIDLQIH